MIRLIIFLVPYVFLFCLILMPGGCRNCCGWIMCSISFAIICPAALLLPTGGTELFPELEKEMVSV